MVGIGATGIQVIQTIKSEVGSMTVFVRTPQYIIPMRNPKYATADVAALQGPLRRAQETVRDTFTGFQYDFEHEPWADQDTGTA